LEIIRLLAAIALLAPPAGAFAGSDRAPYIIDDFESPTPLRNWRFQSDPESPAAAGGLTLGPGHREHGAVLAYRLSSGRNTRSGAYAEALLRFASPLPKKRDPAISLWIRFPPDVEASVVATDASGQTLRLPIRANIEHPKAGNWQYVVVPLPGKARVVEIGILVQARGPSIAQGSITEGTVSFDDLEWRESSETFHIDAAAQAEPPPPESLELAPRLGVNIHLLRDDRSLALAHAAGFAFVRMDMLWANVERAGRYRFFAYDALLRAPDARQMGVLWILDYGHPDHGGGTPRTPQDIAAFGRFAEAVAAHFKGRNVRYEIWNEPNTSQFWPPYPNASEYAALLREAVAAIRRADPAAKVSSGGISRMDEAFLSQAVDPKVAADLTAIGIHPYPKTGPETIAAELGTLRDWVGRAFGDRMEIWDTEWGYSSADAPKEAPSNGHTEAGRRRQAALAVREILTVWTVGLQLAVWYDLHDDGADPANPEHNYGLLDSNGDEKPAMQAVRNLMSVTGGRKYAGMIRETPAGIHAMRFDGAADTLFIVWTEEAWTDQPSKRRTVEYAKQEQISATDLLGKPIKSKDASSGQARVEIDAAGGPIYLLFAGTRAN
jgi:hypothetical protein